MKPVVLFTAFLISLTPSVNSFAQTPKKPESNRFTKVVLGQRLEEPMQIQILKDGKVLLAERKGKLKVYDPKSQSMETVAEFAVSTKYVNKAGEVTEGEYGMQGVILDPDYEKKTLDLHLLFTGWRRSEKLAGTLRVAW